MPVDVRWLIADRVVIHEFSGQVALADTTRASVEGPMLSLAGTPPIHMIVNLLAVTQFPHSIQQLQIAIRQNPHLDRLGLIVIVINQNPMLRFLATILTRVTFSNLRIGMADNMAGALQQLRACDASLHPWISADGELISPPGA
ncbi:MAG: hypothetical protein JNL34_04285 [Anaerolineae bacterium]|nr:hypothetical protein [Anaerolineae bacterium]